MVINSVLLLYTRRRRMTCGPFSHPPSHRYIVVIIITATDRSHRRRRRRHRHICARNAVFVVSDGPDAIPSLFRRASHYYYQSNIDAVSCGYRTVAGIYYYYILLIVFRCGCVRPPPPECRRRPTAPPRPPPQQQTPTTLWFGRRVNIQII